MNRVIIVGAGRMGQLRAKAAHKAGASIHAIVDADEDRAAALAAQFSGAVAETVLGDLSGDALFVCVPPHLHPELAEIAIQRNMALFLEKPLALDAASCSTMLHALQSNPVINAVGFMNRYRTGAQKVKAALQDATVLAMTARWINAAYAVPWWGNPAQSGGSLNEQCAHFIDLARYWVGEIVAVSVTAQPHPQNREITGTAAIQLEFANGAVGTVVYSCAASYKDMAFQVMTADESYGFQGWDLVPVAPVAFAEQAPEDRYEIFDVETATFLQAVATQDQSVIQSDIHDALRTQQVMDAIRHAIETQDRVFLALEPVA